MCTCSFIDNCVKILADNEISLLPHLKGDPAERFEEIVFGERTPSGRRTFIRDTFRKYAAMFGPPPVVPAGNVGAAGLLGNAPPEEFENRVQRAFLNFLEKKPSKEVVHVDMEARLKVRRA